MADCRSSHNGAQMVAHRDVQPKTLKKYGLIVTCLLCFVYRCFEGWDSGYSMKLTSEQKQACQNLKDALVGVPENGAEDDIEFDKDIFDDVEFDLDDDDNQDDEGVELGDGDASATQSVFVENPVQQCILDLLISLFTHLPSGADDKFYTPIYRFVILFSLKKNGEWLAGGRITQLLAAVLFCGRQVVAEKLEPEEERAETKSIEPVPLQGSAPYVGDVMEMIQLARDEFGKECE